MTISTTTIKNSYSGDGSQTVFAYTFKILADADIQVIIRAANGTETVKTLTTDYTVSGAGTASGGNVTFGTAPSSTETVVLRRETTQTQTVDLVENDPFTAETVEGAFDRSILIAQELQEEVDRSIKLSRTNSMTSTEFTVDAATRANKILAFDGSGEIAVTQELGTYKGDWSGSTAYYARDIVKDTSTNSIFICNTAHTSSGAQPLTSNTDSAKWDLLVDAASATSSASAAASSATASASSATASAASATAAAASETAAAASESAAAASESAAAASESAAATSESNAAASEAAAAAIYDNFDDAYLGAKATAPTVDNDGDALQDGALFFNTTSNYMMVYDLGTTTWYQLTPTVSAQTNINTVAGISSDVTTVAGISSDVTTVAGISGDTTTVAGISSNVTTVAGDTSNIGTIATNLTGTDTIGTVATNITNVNNVGTNISNVNTVAGISSDVTAVAGDATDIGTVATDLAGSDNIGTVATNIANVNSVAGNETNINAVNSNAANINTVAGISSNVTTVAGISADVTTAANNVTDITNFADVYIGASATPPTTRADSSALQVGDLYFDTSTDTMKVYSSGGWVSTGSSVNGTADRFIFTVSSSTTTITGTDDSGSTLAYDAGYVDVYLNGVKMVNGTDITATSGTSIVFASAIGASGTDTVDIIAYGTFALANFSVGDANDVSLAGITNGQVLAYNSTSGDLEPTTIISDVVGDTTPQLGGDLDGNGNTIDLTGNTESFGLPVGTAAQAPTASTKEGHIRYNADDDTIYFSNGSNWLKISSAIPTLTNVTGTIYAGATSTLTLTGTNFLTANLVVNFLQSSDGIDEDVTVTPTSDTSATVTVSAAVYNNVTGGNVVTIKVTNSDGATSGNQTTTAIALPSGGTISESGGYRYHAFTSSGTFTNTISQQVEYLIVAGGGAGGCAIGGPGGGGGAGGLLQGTTSTLSVTGYSIVVGAGGANQGTSGTQVDRVGNSGNNSSAFGLTAIGGGGGGGNSNSPTSGGSGGGGQESDGTGASGTSGQGNAGGNGSESNDYGGGGGGAGEAGNTDGNGYGGDGLNYSTWATATSTGDSGYYAGGGAGGYQTTGINGGGQGGGGRSYAAEDGASGVAGQGNTGGGGGAGEVTSSFTEGAGGSGVVIVRYQL